ncbi:hypothetical protein ACLK1S_04175 [Escherichia coli]
MNRLLEEDGWGTERGMPVSKTGALPLGHTPIRTTLSGEWCGRRDLQL